MIFTHYLYRLGPALPYAAAVLGLVCVVSFFGYSIVYRRLLKKQRRFPLRAFVLWGVFVCYLAVLAMVALFQREAGSFNWSNLDFLSSYQRALRTGSAGEWEYIILNILVFVPLGVLLPLLSKAYRRVWAVFLSGAVLSLGIEVTQYYAGLGIFDVDDLFNNALGTLLGAALTVGILRLAHREKLTKKALLGSALFYTALLSALGLYLYLDGQGLGTVGGAYGHRQNMKRVELLCEIPLSEERQGAKLYLSEAWTEARARQFAEDFFARLGTALSDKREPMVYGGSAYYYSDEGHILIVYFGGGSFEFSDPGHYDTEKDSTADEARIRTVLGDMGIAVPGGATFSKNKEGDYTFLAKMCADGDSFVNGTLNGSYYQDGTIKTIQSSLVKCTYLRDCRLISQKEAFQQIEKGKFDHGNTELRSVEILSVHLWYTLDSKGYFQPVYRFNARINGEDETLLTVPAYDRRS